MLLSFPAGWNLDVPAGTIIARVDTVMNTRPGAGGYAAILEASDLKETILIRGGEAETDTERMLRILALRLAEEIHGNRAVIVTRSQSALQILGEIFKPYRMIRMLGHSPLTVCDATRHAHVMAERSLNRGAAHEERLLVARFEPNKEDFNENQDTKSMHSVLQHLIKMLGLKDLSNPAVQSAAQAVLTAAEREFAAHQKNAIRRMTTNDIPKPTREKEK